MTSMKQLIGIAAVLATLLPAAFSYALVTQSQSFDSDPSWSASGNTTVPQDYGFQNTSHITGASAGEAGGTFGATTAVSYYADAAGLVFLTENLAASGKLTVDAFNGFSGRIQLGWLNSTETSTPNFFGLEIVEPTSGSSPFRARLILVRPGGDERASAFVTVDTGKDYDFTMTYDPLGAGGLGEISATLTGIDVVDNEALLMSLGGGDRFGPSQFNAFGLLSPNQVFAGNTNTADFFVDSLQYSQNMIPEPAGLGVLLGAATMLRRRGTRR